MSHYVYILQSLKDKRLYTGITANVDKRLQAHNSGSTRSTKNRKPFACIYTEKYSTRSEARSREKFLKSIEGAKVKSQIVNNCRIV